MKIQDFSNFLQTRAYWTHDIIRKGTIHQLGVMEETITDMHLLSIADSFPNHVITKKFNRREEGSVSGADWLWVIGAPGSWIPLLVQAKIINPKTGNCLHLDHNNGEQRKRLLCFARHNMFVPVYCIYSYIPSRFIPPKLVSADTLQKEDWACSFISPRTVRILSRMGLKHQDDILDKGIPWMLPFRQLTLGETRPGNLIADSFLKIRDSLDPKKENKCLMVAKNNRKGIVNWEYFDTRKAVVPVIPRSICNLLKGTDQQAGTPISGISVFSTIPTNQIKELENI